MDGYANFVLGLGATGSVFSHLFQKQDEEIPGDPFVTIFGFNFHQNVLGLEATGLEFSDLFQKQDEEIPGDPFTNMFCSCSEFVLFKRGWGLKLSLGLFGSKIHIFEQIEPKLWNQGANGCPLRIIKFGQDKPPGSLSSKDPVGSL